MKAINKTVPTWPVQPIKNVRGCFEDTNYLKTTDCLDEYTDTVSGYIKFCEEIQLLTKTVNKYPNSKPWFDSLICAKIQAEDCKLIKSAKPDRVQKGEIRFRETYQSHKTQLL